MNFLEKVISEKTKEIQNRKERKSLIESIKGAKKEGRNAIIGEAKRISPLLGVINEIDVCDAAEQIEKGGACGVSILTDKNFGGNVDDLLKVKERVNLPILRKDFIIDEFQIYESYVHRADAVLLISTILLDKTPRFVRLTHKLGMEVMLEVYSKEDLDYALNSDAKLIAVNNRDLRTRKVDLNHIAEIAPNIPEDRLIVGASGILTKKDLNFVLEYADACLIGTGIMHAEDIEEKVREFVY